MKLKTCKICKEKFRPDRQMQMVCSPKCSIEYANQHLNKKATKTKQTARKALKQYNMNDIPVLKRRAQKIFNEFIRLRDKNLPCVSCQKIIGKDETSHASHFRPATNSRLRYDERNVWRSCVKCNVFLSSNAIEYKKALIIKLGIDVVEELETTNDTYKYTKEELQEIIKTYREKVKVLKNLE